MTLLIAAWYSHIGFIYIKHNVLYVQDDLEPCQPYPRRTLNQAFKNNISIEYAAVIKSKILFLFLGATGALKKIPKS